MRLLSLAVVVAIACAPLGARADRLSTQRVSGKIIAQLAGDALKSLPADRYRAYVAATMVSDQVVPAGSVTMHAGTPVANPTFVNVPVEIDLNGSVARTVYVGYRVQQFVETAVAAHDIAPGSLLSADDLVMRKVSATGRSGNGIDILVGRRANGTFLKGQPVALDATLANQIVRAGSTVILVVRDGAVSLT